MTRRFLGAVGVCAMLTMAAAAADWTVPVVNLRSYSVGDIGAIAYNAPAGKLYVGLQSTDRRSLAVFDIDPQGNLLGAPRRYAIHPEPLGSTNWSKVVCALLDPRHQKLFLGLNHGYYTSTSNCLVMVSLDAKGEPTGPPETFWTGNPSFVCNALALHPTLNRLYTSGWGCNAVYAFDLDATGRPVAPPLAYPVGNLGKHSIGFSADASRIYLGSYHSTIEVCDLTPGGAVTNAPRTFGDPTGSNLYLVASTGAHGIYFRATDGRLKYFPLQPNGEPTGELNAVDSFAATAFALPAPDRLIVAIPALFTDVFTGQVGTNGSRLREVALAANGAPAQTLRETPLFERTTVRALTATPDAAVVGDQSPGFVGNAYRGLQVRFRVDAIRCGTNLAVAPRTVTLGTNARYLPFAYSSRHQMVYAPAVSNVTAWSLSSTGAPVRVDAGSNITDAIAVDGDLGLLDTAHADGSIDIRPLLADGTPAAAGERVPTGLTSIQVLAVNPKSHHVYVCGYGTATGPVTNAASAAAQRLIQIPCGGTPSDAAVDPTRGRLYVTRTHSGADGHGNLLVWTLAPDGTLADPIPRVFADALPLPAVTNDTRGIVSALALNSARNRLYLGAYLESYYKDRGTGRLVVYTLDAQGDPTGTPRLYPTPNPAGCIDALAIAANGRWLYESGWGDGRVFVRTLDQDGEPSAGSAYQWIRDVNGKCQLTPTPDGRRLLAGAYNDVLEIHELSADGLPQPGAALSFTAKSITTNLGSRALGQMTDWINLDPAISNETAGVLGTLSLGGGIITSAVVTSEWAIRDGNQLRPLAKRESRLDGPTASFVFPGAGADPGGRTNIAALIETEAMLFQRYLSYARPHALKPNERPRQFVVANGLIGLASSSSLPALDGGLDTLADLGHNTAQIWGFSPQIPPAAIHDAALRRGINRFRWTIYNPPSYFDYNTALVAPAFLDKWAEGLVNEARAMGAKPDEFALFHLADEPGWYFPGQLTDVATNAARLAVFHDYLKSKGLDPAFFGHASWDTIKPLGLSAATTLPAKHLLFWTARFYAESLSKGFAAATAALRRQFNPRMLIGSNLNNWPGRFFVPSPGAKIYNNSDAGPDAAYGGPDWFDLGRKGALTCLWSEDWFPDAYAQQWSFYADLMRCAAREGGLEFGNYVVGASTSQITDGAKYKIMALAGHGNKAFDLYAFGSFYAFGDCWSESPNRYRALADGIRFLGKSEKLLYPGRPRTGTVAILFPQASQVWDGDAAMHIYLHELSGLHSGLIHAQYPVDFVDDFGVEAGDLAKYGYSTLYVTAPNLSAKAQQAILEWVQQGGTLALSPGACQADEYNEPLTVLTFAAGATPGVVPRKPIPQLSDPQTALTVTDQQFGAAAEQTRAQTTPLTLTDATTVAAFADGQPAIAQKPVGRGRIITFGYWPGATYQQSAEFFDTSRLPQGWSAPTRSILTAPARMAGAKKHVDISTALVEGVLLESDQGLAVTLLNWSGDPLKEITVRVALPTGFPTKGLKVHSTELGKLKSELTPAGLQVRLPLKTVDVLTIEPPAAKGWFR